ncbi:MAG: agmatine deiminase family protein, partial [Ignavibacteria bacterium]|nr:agmatine deiminase family protein [Ignavibacteria bacterium]
MKKILFQFSLFFLVAQSLLAQGLPRNYTEIKEKIPKLYQQLILDGFTTPPEFNVRTAAEWEEMQGLLINWDSDHNELLGQIVDYAQEECMVFIISTAQDSVENYLTGVNIPLNNIAFINAPTDAFWVRDYGPVSIYKNYTEELSFVDWRYYSGFYGRPHDDVIPGTVADYLGINVYHTTAPPYELRNYGGNFMSDGHGAGFSTYYVLSHDDEEGNPNLSEPQINMIMQAFNGINPYLKVETLPINAIDHIDMYMKLLDEETILVGEYASGVQGSQNNVQIQENIDYILNNFSTCFGRDYQIIRIPMPPIEGTIQRTYTNSLILNKTVLVPIYDKDPAMDLNALSIYQNAMPGYNVIGINSELVIPLSGAIHCITMGVGDEDPVFISHAKIREVANTGPYKINVFLNTQSGIQNSFLFWSNQPGGGYQSVQLVPTGNDNYTAYLPPQAAGNNVYYYISASSNTGKTIKKPFTGGSPNYGYFKFQVPPTAAPPYNLSLNNETILSGITVEFQASNSISAISNYTVKNGADVTFTAGNSITLNGPLNIELGAEFNAEVYP